MATGYILWSRNEKRLVTDQMFPTLTDANNAIRKFRAQSPALAGVKSGGKDNLVAPTIDAVAVTY